MDMRQKSRSPTVKNGVVGTMGHLLALAKVLVVSVRVSAMLRESTG